MMTPTQATSPTLMTYGSSAETRQAGIHYWSPEIRRLGASHGVNVHTNLLNECVGMAVPCSALFAK